jgi:catechol-2,3-dioxygenase
MKRIHVHVKVNHLETSIRFYSELFATTPTVVKTDYAKWMLEDPRVNFAISSTQQSATGIEHLGIQADDEADLATIYSRLKKAEQPILEEGSTTCCYAKSDKNWTKDPDGVVWEAFFTRGEATVYGDKVRLSAQSDNATENACCTPAMPVAAKTTCKTACGT